VVQMCASATSYLGWEIQATGTPGVVNLKHHHSGLCLSWTGQPVPASQAVAFELVTCPGLNWYYVSASQMYAVYGQDIAIQIPTGVYGFGGASCGMIP